MNSLKLFLSVIFSLLLLGCNENKQIKVTKDDMVNSKKVAVDSTSKQNDFDDSRILANPDSTSFSYFKYLFEHKIEIPSQLCSLYLNEDREYVENYGAGCFPDSILNSNDRFTVFTYTIQCAAGGVCEDGKLVTLDNAGKIISKINSHGQFGDLGFLTQYSFKYVAPDRIYVTYKKEEYNENNDVTKDTSYVKKFIINRDGKIIKDKIEY